MGAQPARTDDVETLHPASDGGAGTETDVDTDEELVDLWLSQKSDNTADAYRRDVDQALSHLGKHLGELRLEDVVEWGDECERRGWAKSTQSRKLAALKSLLTFGHRVGYLEANAGRGVELPQPKDDLGERILSESEVQKMLVVADGRDAVLLALLYGIGARISEITGLKWRDLQPHDGAGVVTLYGKGDKTRTARVPESVWSKLKALRPDEAGADDPVFASQKGGPLSRSQAYRIVRKVADEAGIDTDERPVSPHWLRHAHASHSLDRGAPVHLVQETLGHASVQTTSRYLHARPEESSGDYLGV